MVLAPREFTLIEGVTYRISEGPEKVLQEVVTFEACAGKSLLILERVRNLLEPTRFPLRNHLTQVGDQLKVFVSRFDLVSLFGLLLDV